MDHWELLRQNKQTNKQLESYPTAPEGSRRLVVVSEDVRLRYIKKSVYCNCGADEFLLGL